MFRNISMLTKHPYTAGVIACTWAGSAILTAIDPQLPLVEMATINVVATSCFAIVGFGGK